jgi:hypothetical protein
MWSSGAVLTTVTGVDCANVVFSAEFKKNRSGIAQIPVTGLWTSCTRLISKKIKARLFN